MVKVAVAVGVVVAAKEMVLAAEEVKVLACFVAAVVIAVSFVEIFVVVAVVVVYGVLVEEEFVEAVAASIDPVVAVL